MQTLYLDLASHNGLLSCVTDTAVVAAFPVDHRIDDSELLPHVEAVLKKAGWKYSDLTHLACVTGPGGFTSLRVAVALANALASELKIPVAGIHLSDVYRVRAAATISKSPLPWWFHSTKKQELFIRGGKFPEPTCITLDELRKHLTSGSHWMGELIPEQRKIVDDAGLIEALLAPTEKILPEFLKTQSFNSRSLEPWYGRGW